jgi:hypothetical protein
MIRFPKLSLAKEFPLQQQIERQQLLVTQALATGHRKLLLQPLTGPLRRPTQPGQQVIALGEELGAGQGEEGGVGLAPGWQGLQGPAQHHQIGVAGEFAPTGLAEQPLQIDPLLLPAPTQGAQELVQLVEIGTPIVRVGGRFGAIVAAGPPPGRRGSRDSSGWRESRSFRETSGGRSFRGS